MTKTDVSAVRPFHFSFPEAALVDMRKRVNATRWPERETVADATQGVQLATMQKLADYWGKDYDWSKCEAELKALPHFITEIDGLDIHFIHVRSKHERALPVIVTHGWPGSVIEQLKIIDPLTNPEAHGGHASDAFDLVIPSLPRLRILGQAGRGGLGPGARRARLDRADGAPWLYEICGARRTIGVRSSPNSWARKRRRDCSASTPTCRAPFHPTSTRLLWRARRPYPVSRPTSGMRTISWCSSTRKAWPTRRRWGTAHRRCTGSRIHPSASPAGSSTTTRAANAMMSRVFDGKTEGLTRDDILDNITFYWLTNTGISSARLYWENKLAFFAPQNIQIPAAVSVYPDEIYAAPRSWVEKAFPNLIYFNKLPKGGHFAAWEQPAFFVSDVRAAFKSLRT